MLKMLSGLCPQQAKLPYQTFVRFSVTDTGIGIPQPWQERLFHELVQVPDASAGPGRGTGLGLTICKRLASMMGGDVGLTSAPGQGSLFWFTAALPIAHEGGEEPSRDRATFSKASFTGRLRDIRILVVEDDPAIREALSRLLASLSLHADIAENGAIALERIRDTELR
jgi:hypothetical protein